MRWRFLCALVFLVFGTVPGSVIAESRTVVEIQIRGNRKIETDAILSRLRTKVGTEVSRDNISEDIRSIAKLRFFEGIEGISGLRLTK